MNRRSQSPQLPEEFELIEQIGAGASGAVYSVKHLLLDRTVAIKALRTGVTDIESHERFLREGRICCRIQSPYVVRVFDIRVFKDRVFLVMELVEGASVQEWLLRRPFTIPEALKIGEEVALGLDAAHRIGVIHRDVKPGNILLGPQGRARLSDFGIAKDLGAEVLTAPGEGLGTFAYVAPEQAKGARDVDPRADVYSLGATLYHLIAGRRPFSGVGARVLLAVLHEQPPALGDFRPDCPPQLAALVHSMMAKAPGSRPATAELVAQKLRASLAEFFPDFIPDPERFSGPPPQGTSGEDSTPQKTSDGDLATKH